MTKENMIQAHIRETQVDVIISYSYDNYKDLQSMTFNRNNFSLQ